MSPREYAVAMSLGILIGAVLGGLVMVADIQPFETIDDAVGEDELAGVADGPRAGEPLVGSGTATEAGAGTATPTATPTTTATAAPTATETASDAAANGGSTETATPTGTAAATSGGTATQSAFAFQIDEVTECGATCRTVTATVKNQQSAAVTTTTETRMYVGNTTESSARVFQDTQGLGRLQPGESVTTNTDVELSASEALQVQDAGGWVTIVTVVTGGDETVRTVERRKVLE